MVPKSKPDSFNRSVTNSPSPKFLNYSNFTDPNTKVTLVRGSPCHSIVTTKKQAYMEIDSPFDVSSEDSTGLRCPGHKAYAKIEGMDLKFYLKLIVPR